MPEIATTLGRRLLTVHNVETEQLTNAKVANKPKSNRRFLAFDALTRDYVSFHSACTTGHSGKLHGLEGSSSCIAEMLMVGASQLKSRCPRVEPHI